MSKTDKKRQSSKDTAGKVRERYRNREVKGRRPGERPADFKGTAKRLLKEFSPFKGLMAVVLIAGIGATVLSTVGPMLLGDVVDTISDQISVRLSGQKVDLLAIGKTLLVIFSIYLGSSLLSFVQHYIMAGVSQKVICNLREKLNAKISVMPFTVLDSKAKGELLSRMMNDVDNISNSLQNSIIQIITSLISFFGIFFIMVFMSWKLTLLSVAVLPFAGVIAAVLLKKSKRYFRRQWHTNGDINAHIEEMFTGHKIVRVFNHEDTAIDEFNKVNEKLFEESRKAQFISGILMPFISFINNIGYIVICIAGGMFVVAKEMTVGQITSFIAYSKLFIQPVIDLSNISNKLQSSLASAERVYGLLDCEEESADCHDGTVSDNPSTVTFDHVSFRYLPEKPLIEDFNLEVKKGQLVAIVGPTGAGKTTMVNLLMRFYDVGEGAIKIDGVDIRSIPRENLRSVFGMVLQDTWLFNGTVRDNIAYGRADATQEEIEKAARSAKVDHFVKTLADGYDTVLDEDGTNISQGQRQLLTIARSLIADPPILILDEATSSVDTRTEVQIQQAMQNLMHGRTNFVIAHRLSTICKADVILVMNHGRIVEKGTHESLMAQNGFYTKLYNSQFAGNTI